MRPARLRPLAFSAHLGYLFTDLPLEARLAAAAAAGFEAVEHPAPFAIPAPQLARMLADHGLGFAQLSSGLGAPGEKGLAALPGRETDFREGFARALDYAETIGSPFLHPMAGVGGDASTYARNIETALRMAEGRGVRVLVEAISAAAVPGYAMARIEDLLALAGRHPDLRLLIDSFHARAAGWEPAAAIRAAGAQLGHLHLADFPGRAEPGSGGLDFGALWPALRDAGFTGAIGFEYQPTGAAHLDWLPAFRAARHGAVRERPGCG